jgi:nucleotide-binding universal stress UspA family protein
MSKTILVPVDGSPLSERAVRYAVKNFPDASVTAIHVINPLGAVTASEAGGIPEGDEWYRSAQTRADAITDSVAAVAAEHGVELATASEVGRPSREILRYADEHGVDQIVLGSHGRDGISRAILGSVAELVVRRAEVPVTVVR